VQLVDRGQRRDLELIARGFGFDFADRENDPFASRRMNARPAVPVEQN
jgi:hypothetical protein